jgi:hypothetical protein
MAELFIGNCTELLYQKWEDDHYYLATEIEHDELLEKIQIMLDVEADIPNMN